MIKKELFHFFFINLVFFLSFLMNILGVGEFVDRVGVALKIDRKI